MRREIILIITACITSCLCFAQEDDDNRKLPDITVIGSKLDTHKLPASGDYLNEKDIRQHSYDNVHQVLRKTTGVYIQEETGSGLLPNISLRGVDTHRSQKITIMEDGVLTAPAPYSAPSAYYAPTMGRMSGLEALKGSSQIKYGPHTTGGIINYLSTPVPFDQTTYLKALYGSFNELRFHGYRGTTRETSIGDIGTLIEIYHRQNDGFKTIRHASGNDDQTGFRKTDYMLKLSWEPAGHDNQLFELKLGYTGFQADETYLGISEADFDSDPFQRYYASHFDNFKGDHLRTYLKHLLEISDTARLTSTAYYNKFHRNWYKLNDIKDVQGLASGVISMSEALASGGAALATLKGENAGTWRVRANNRDYDLWGLQSILESNFEKGGTKHSLETGLRYHTDHARQYQWQNELTVDNSGSVVSTSEGAKGDAGNRLDTSRAIAAFIQDDMSRNKLTVSPGIRAEHIDYQINDRSKNTGNQTKSMAVFAAGINARYDLAHECILFAGLYRGYSVPSPGDYISKDLEEETSISGEFGARCHKKGIGGQATAFYTAFRDLIVGGYVGTATDTDAENAGDINNCGLELQADIDPGVIYDWGFKNPCWVACTLTQARLDGDTTSQDPASIFSGGEDGNKVPYIPDFQVSLGYGLEFEKLTLELAGIYVDETYSTANNSSEHVNPVTGKPDARFGKIDARLLLNISARYDCTEKLALFAGIHNLLDEEYLASRHPNGPRPGQPLTAMTGIETTF